MLRRCAQTSDLVINFHILPRSEFIHMLSTEANEICEAESKKTIAPEHILGALKVHLFDGSSL